MPMIRMVIRKVYLRPTRSPSRPNTSAPNGRTRKPAAKASSAKTFRVASGNDEKNCAPMIAASDPYRKKSYHSKIVPADDARMTFFSSRVMGRFLVAAVPAVVTLMLIPSVAFLVPRIGGTTAGADVAVAERWGRQLRLLRVTT